MAEYIRFFVVALTMLNEAIMNENTSSFDRECCVCHKVYASGRWRMVFKRRSGRQVSHGYCPACLKRALLQVDIFFDDMRVSRAG